jgi:hypothetical protein
MLLIHAIILLHFVICIVYCATKNCMQSHNIVKRYWCNRASYD